MSTDVVLPTDPIAEQPKRSWIRRMFALIDRARRRFVLEWDSSMSLRTAVIAAAATIIGSLFLAFFLTQQITNGLFPTRRTADHAGVAGPVGRFGEQRVQA